MWRNNKELIISSIILTFMFIFIYILLTMDLNAGAQQLKTVSPATINNITKKVPSDKIISATDYVNLQNTVEVLSDNNKHLQKKIAILQAIVDQIRDTLDNQESTIINLAKKQNPEITDEQIKNLLPIKMINEIRSDIP